MELSVVVPYLTEERDFEFFENLENFSDKLRSQDIKLELIIACTSANPRMLHKANLFANNLSYARVAFTKYRGINKIISCGANKCNRNNTLILRGSFTGCNSIDYTTVISTFMKSKRFSLFKLEADGVAVGIIGRTYDVRIVSDFLTAKTIDEVISQINEFHIRWGTCTLVSDNFDTYVGYVGNTKFRLAEKLRLTKFLNSCHSYYISYLAKTKKSARI